MYIYAHIKYCCCHMFRLWVGSLVSLQDLKFSGPGLNFFDAFSYGENISPSYQQKIKGREFPITKLCIYIK